MSFLMTHKRSVLLAFAMFFVGVFLLFGFWYYLVSPTHERVEGRVFLVEAGSSLKQVASELEARGIIRSKEFFLLWARVAGGSRNIKAGEYQLNTNMSPLSVFDILRKGRIITHAVTIPEGFTRKQIAETLALKGIVSKKEFLRFTADRDVVKSYGISAHTLEGYLYPDTYHFSRNLPPKAIVEVMVKRFWEAFEPFRERATELGKDLEEVVTLASIVEKETGLADERPLIASVFLNRLRKGIRLASDPTVIYGISEFNGNLTRTDLMARTPYNTYVIKGLPPGPIANPGTASIRAVLYPAETDYLYFVSKNDGSHYFSKTLSEHNRAVRKYQRSRRRSNAGS